MRILRPLEDRLLLTATVFLFEPEYCTTLDEPVREDLAEPRVRPVLRLEGAA